MSFSASLLMVFAAGSTEPVLRLAQPQQVSEAISGCLWATVSPEGPDPARLVAVGWSEAGTLFKAFAVHRRVANEAVILRAKTGFGRDACFVRANLHDEAVYKGVSRAISALVSVAPYQHRRANRWTWRTATHLVAMEPFDAQTDGTPITQIVVVALPKEYR